jgi:hypothetical protein
MATKLPYKIAYSGKAYREGFWPTLEWAVFDRNGAYLEGCFRSRAEARAWAQRKFGK